ncbi:putative fatty acid hydroxylase [Helianthus annuus]|nr:putative fatty acid hydroxylase [Helianthus annuus]
MKRLQYVVLVPWVIQHLPIWRLDGVIIVIVLHVGPVEFLYYWFHRALHHHFLYNRYHSHHHSSIVTEPITCKFLSLNTFCLFFKGYRLWSWSQNKLSLRDAWITLHISIMSPTFNPSSKTTTLREWS